MSYGEVIESSTQRLRKLTQKGGTIIGYLYPHTPIELLMAHGLTPSLIRVNPSSSAGFEDSLQTFSCSFTRNIYSQRANGGLLDLSGIVFPGNTCDALQNVADVWRYRYPDDKVFRLTYPITPVSDASIDFLAHEIKKLSDSIAEAYGKSFSKSDYTDSVNLVNQFRDSAQFLYAARVYDSTIISYSKLTGLVRDFLTAPDSSVIDELLSREQKARKMLRETGLEEAVEKLRTCLLTGDFNEMASLSQKFPRIVIAGGMVEPQAIASLLGGIDSVSEDVLALDILSFGFKIVFTPKTPLNENPFRDLAEVILQAPSEPTHEGLNSRVSYLKQMLVKLGIRGLVVSEQSFCDPDEFEAPSLEKAAKEVGIPSMRLPMDPEISDRGRLEGRLQTFLETLEGEEVE
ncbi:MAG: 2-hydroxyacyl-CoA dehydratase [Candidatus Thorarchaeota archaeon]